METHFFFFFFKFAYIYRQLYGTTASVTCIQKMALPTTITIDIFVSHAVTNIQNTLCRWITFK